MAENGKKRGRPIGSKNIKNGSNVFAMNFDKQIAGAPVTAYNAQYNIINYGKDNQYPYKLIDFRRKKCYNHNK